MGNISKEVQACFYFNENSIFRADNISSHIVNINSLFYTSFIAAKTNGIIENALYIDTDGRILSENNKPKLVNMEYTIQMSDECEKGIRMVFIYDDNNYFVIIIGKTKTD